MADKNDKTKKEERLALKSVAPTDNTPQFSPKDLTLIPMIDPESGFWGLLCSGDNGMHWKYEYGPNGKRYYQRDIDRISAIPFEQLLMKSPNGTIFSLKIDDDGNLVKNKIKSGKKDGGNK